MLLMQTMSSNYKLQQNCAEYLRQQLGLSLSLALVAGSQLGLAGPNVRAPILNL